MLIASAVCDCLKFQGILRALPAVGCDGIVEEKAWRYQLRGFVNGPLASSRSVKNWHFEGAVARMTV